MLLVLVTSSPRSEVEGGSGKDAAGEKAFESRMSQVKFSEMFDIVLV